MRRIVLSLHGSGISAKAYGVMRRILIIIRQPQKSNKNAVDGASTREKPDRCDWIRLVMRPNQCIKRCVLFTSMLASMGSLDGITDFLSFPFIREQRPGAGSFNSHQALMP